jgi:hypothetical protein
MDSNRLALFEIELKGAFENCKAEIEDYAENLRKAAREGQITVSSDDDLLDQFRRYIGNLRCARRGKRRRVRGSNGRIDKGRFKTGR